MELTELKDRIIESFNGSKEDLDKVLSIVEEDQAIFPFNEYEHLICNLIEKGGLSYDQYLDKETQKMAKIREMIKDF